MAIPQYLSFMNSFLSEPFYALVGLGGVLFLILLYLIRPKPKKQVLPSLMFLMKDKGKNVIMTFFRYILRDPLFLLQLLLLLSLAVAAGSPFINVAGKTFFGRTVLILDTSASMGAISKGIVDSEHDVYGRTRFDKAVKIAKDSAGTRNSLVLASKVPIVMLDDVSKGELIKALNSLEVKDTPSSIFNSLMEGKKLVKGNARFVVISDFGETEVENDIFALGRALEAEGNSVEFINVGGEADNVGFIGADFVSGKINVQIRNYNDYSVPVEVFDETNNKLLKSVTLEGNKVLSLSLSQPSGDTELGLRFGNGYKDMLDSDNKLYVASPEARDLRVLVISNSELGSDSFKAIYASLLSISKTSQSSINIELAKPPKVPDINVKDYDLVFMHDVNPSLLLPGVVKDIEKFVEAGGSFVLAAWPEMLKGKDEFKELFDLAPSNLDGAELVEEQSAVFGTDNSLAKDVGFGTVNKYFSAGHKAGGIAIAKTGGEGGNEIISYMKKGEGYVMYYGIFDKYGNFKADVYYPIFWKRAVFNLFLGQEDVNLLNVKTGTRVTLDDSYEVKGPGFKKKMRVIDFDKAGFYHLPKKTMSANLLNQRESNLKPVTDKESNSRFMLKGDKEKYKKEITDLIIFIALALIGLELLFMKFRGDL